MKNKTAVEWLIEQLAKVHFKTVCPDLANQALELEKQQHFDTYCKGFTRKLGNKYELFDKYYSETYKPTTEQEYTDEDIQAYRQAEIELCVLCRFGNDPCTCGEDDSVNIDYDDDNDYDDDF